MSGSCLANCFLNIYDVFKIFTISVSMEEEFSVTSIPS